MSDRDIEEAAARLQRSSTELAIISWMRTWLDLSPGHPQYHMRDDQIKIANLALGVDI